MKSRSQKSKTIGYAELVLPRHIDAFRDFHDRGKKYASALEDGFKTRRANIFSIKPDMLYLET